MKTKIFTSWTNLVEDFIKKIPHDQNQLNDWFDTTGAQMFEVGQRDYFMAHKDEYLKKGVDKDTLAQNQLIVGFDTVYEAMIKDFSLERSTQLINDYKIFLEACVADQFEIVIAARAAITTRYAKSNFKTPKENILSTISDYQFLQQSCQAAVESMQAYLANMPPETIARNSSSAVMYKQASPETKKEDATLNPPSNQMRVGKF